MKSLASITSRLASKKQPPQTLDLQNLSPIKHLFHLPHATSASSDNSSTPTASDNSTPEASPLESPQPLDQPSDTPSENLAQKAPATPVNVDMNLKGLAAFRQFANKLNSKKEVTAGERPIRVVIGFLANVAERDALEYAMGVCEKLFDQLSITFYDVFPYEDGFIYEIHEGGPGRAYAPLFISSFKNLGPFDPTTAQTNAFLIPTGSRHVEVIRIRGGVSSLMLPESYVLPFDKETVAPSSHVMTPAFNQRTGFLTISAIFFAVSFFAFVVTALVQRQPYEPPPPVANEKLEYRQLPSAQWPNLVLQAQAGKVIKALRYKDGSWKPIETQ